MGSETAQALQAHSKRGDRRFHRPLAFLLVPDAQAANAVLANGHLLARAEFPASAALLRDMLAVESSSGGEDFFVLPSERASLTAATRLGDKARP